MSSTGVVRLIAILALAATSAAAQTSADQTKILPNDNRRPAGTTGAGGLAIRLVVRTGDWYPEASDGPHLTVPAFAEEGSAPSIPGPMIRVPSGMVVRARVRNALPDSTIFL